MDHSSLQLQHPLGSRTDSYPDTCGQTRCGPQQHRYIEAYGPLSLPVCCPGSVHPSFLLSCRYMLLLPFLACLFLAPSSATLSPAQSNQLCLCLLSRCQLYPIIFTSLDITQRAHLGKAEQTRGNDANCRCSARYHRTSSYSSKDSIYICQSEKTDINRRVVTTVIGNQTWLKLLSLMTMPMSCILHGKTLAVYKALPRGVTHGPPCHLIS